jgi:hypothetical protein
LIVFIYVYIKNASTLVYNDRMKHIIAICGEKRSGKDVLAEHLVRNHGYTKISFADPLKKVVKTLFNFSDIQVGIDEGENAGCEKDTVDDRWGISPRQALQFFGTEVLQYKIQELLPTINRDFFAESLVSRIKATSIQKYVINDLRFLHEYQKLKETTEAAEAYEVLIIRIVRPRIIDNIVTVDDIGWGCNTSQHISEKEYLNIPYDFEIVNDSTIEKYIEAFEIKYKSNK